jgi:hypothetical protein
LVGDSFQDRSTNNDEIEPEFTDDEAYEVAASVLADNHAPDKVIAFAKSPREQTTFRR